MRRRSSPALLILIAVTALCAMGLLALAHAGGGPAQPGGTQPGLKPPPTKLDPGLLRWRTMAIQKIDRELKAKLAAAEELRRRLQLQQDSRLRASEVTAPRVIPSRTGTVEPLRLVGAEPGSGEPGDLIRFYFNKNPGAYDAVYEAHFLVAPSRDERSVGRLAYTQDGRWSVVASVPYAFDIAADYAGRAYIKIDATNSNTVPFTYKPQIVHSVMGMTRVEWLDDMTFGGSYGGWVDADLGSGIVCHEMLPVLGDKGDDEWWKTFRLKNNWTVESVKVEGQTAMNNIPFGCTVTSSRPGTNSPYIKVHWWFDRGGAPFVYYATIFIKGPAGTHYK